MINKKLFKRSVALLLCVSLLFSLCSCSTLKSYMKRAKRKVTGETTTVTQRPSTRVTFPEGSTAVEIAQKLEDNGVCSKEDFLAEVRNPENLSLINYPLADTDKRAFLLEGYVFPDTYDFYLDIPAREALTKFTENFNVKVNTDIEKRASELGFTVDEIITLASIIQEEAGHPVDMPCVSSVIHNRLNSSSYPRIECDVAVHYLMDTVKPFYDAEKYSELCDYYNIVSDRDGLPVGAITNPGLAAINAALEPADTDYYFFVTDKEGNYYFAETYAEHCENCHTAGIEGY